MKTKTIKLSEQGLRKLVNESVKRILKENAYYEVWDELEELREYMQDKDIVARIISRIGPDAALKIIKDIKTTELQDWITSGNEEE